LPNLPTNCIVYQNNAASFDPLYVGMDVGVYYRDNTMSSWVLYNTGLPNVGVMELEIHYTALKLRAATFGRSIWQSNLNTPGGAVAPPVSDFIANKTNICVGQCINYTDLSAGSATSWSWSFSGGTPATSSLQNPTNICYNTPGIYTATMVATNAGGSNTMTKTGYIVVSAPIALPLSEGFQGTTFVPSAWSLSNPDADVTWVQNTTAGGYAASTKCASLDNLTPATTTAGKTDDLLTPKYNFTSVSTASLSFDVAYCRYDATYFDSLIVYVSTNCGTTWSRIYSKGGTALATAPDQTVIFAPTSTQWRTETVSMTPYAGQANVMLKFQNKSGWGQILYLDNINISTAVASVGITQTGGTNPMCAGSSATFTATATNGGSTPTYQWQVNGANVGVNSPTYTTTALTNGDIIKCIMTSSLGSVAGSPATSATITMMVNAIPAAPTAGSNSPVCEGTMLNLTSNTISGASYSWSGPGSYASSSEDPNRPSATAGMAGTYSVTATVAGCTSLMGTTTVVVNPSVTPSVVIAASPGGPICSGNPVLFTATLSNGGSSPGYQWQVNGTNAGTGATFTSSALNNGDAISCSLTSNATCASPVTASSNIITMTVDPTPAIPVITQSGAVLTSSASAGNQWYLDGVLIPGANGQTYTITVNGTYTVMVTNGPCSSLSTPLVFTTMGIADVQNVNQLSIFPNPNDGNFTISFTATEETSYTLELTNALGQLIYREELIQYSGTYSKSFSVLSYGRGIYTISLSNDKNEAVRKIIVY
jgi:PKD repeat protein